MLTFSRRQELPYLPWFLFTAMTTFGATVRSIGLRKRINIKYLLQIWRKNDVEMCFVWSVDIFSFGVASDINISSFTAEPYVEYQNFNVNYIFLHKEKELRYFFWQKRREGPFKVVLNTQVDFSNLVKTKFDDLPVILHYPRLEKRNNIDG